MEEKRREEAILLICTNLHRERKKEADKFSSFLLQMSANLTENFTHHSWRNAEFIISENDLYFREIFFVRSDVSRSAATATLFTTEDEHLIKRLQMSKKSVAKRLLKHFKLFFLSRVSASAY